MRCPLRPHNMYEESDSRPVGEHEPCRCSSTEDSGSHVQDAPGLHKSSIVSDSQRVHQTTERTSRVFVGQYSNPFPVYLSGLSEYHDANRHTDDFSRVTLIDDSLRSAEQVPLLKQYAIT